MVYQGKPISTIEIDVYRPGDKATDELLKLAPNVEGFFSFTPRNPGRYGLLTSAKFDEKGTHEGRPYTSRLYTSTLTVDISPLPFLPAPLDRVACDDKDLQRFFLVEGPSFAKVENGDQAGKEDALVWSLGAKEAMSGKKLASILHRRYAAFFKSVDHSERRGEEIVRIGFQLPKEFQGGTKDLEKGQSIRVWISLGDHLPAIRQQARLMRIGIELE